MKQGVNAHIDGMRTILLTLLLTFFAAICVAVIFIAGNPSEPTAACIAAAVIGAIVVAVWALVIHAAVQQHKSNKSFKNHWKAKTLCEAHWKSFATFKGHF